MTQAFNLAQLANNVNSSGQLDASTGLYNTGAIGFASGTVMLFVQTTAPTGWTKVTTHNDKALRVVSGTAGSGGSVGFSTALATPSVSGSVSATTLSTSQIPSHNHSMMWNSSSKGSTRIRTQSGPTSDLIYYSGNTGGGGSHTHSLSGASTTINVAYVDTIIATKN